MNFHDKRGQAEGHNLTGREKRLTVIIHRSKRSIIRCYDKDICNAVLTTLHCTKTGPSKFLATITSLFYPMTISIAIQARESKRRLVRKKENETTKKKLLHCPLSPSLLRLARYIRVRPTPKIRNSLCKTRRINIS